MSTTSSASPRAYWPVNGLAKLFDFAATSHKRATGVLVLISLILWLPGVFQTPPVDRDEAYFAQATKQMIQSGDYVDIRYQDDFRYRKPIGIYWLQAAVVNTASALGVANAQDKIWLYRVPSLLGAMGAVLATYWCALAFVGRRGATMAALMMSASVILGVEARLAKTDAVLLLTIVVAMGALGRIYLSPHRGLDRGTEWRIPAIFWTALAAGILIKGPVILMIVGLTVLALSILDRSVRWLWALRPIAGAAWFLLLVLPWFVAIYMRVGDRFLFTSIDQDMLVKITSGQQFHGAPPGLYVVLFFLTFFPGAPLAGLATPAIWAVRREPAARFLLAWLLPSWIIFELVVTKLPNYVMPLYPAIAILISAAVESKVLSRRIWLVRATMLWFIGPILFCIAMIAMAIVVNHSLALLAWPFFAGAIVCGLFAWQLYQEDGAERAFLNAVGASILMAFGTYGVIIPSLEPAFPSVALARVLHGASCEHPLAVSTGYEEPSLVFLAGTGTYLTDDPSAAADFLLKGGCRFAFVDTPEERAFALRAEAIGLHYARGQTIEGYNFTTGQAIKVVVFKSTSAQ